jgi:Domain of unknown function (DUF5753)
MPTNTIPEWVQHAFRELVLKELQLIRGSSTAHYDGVIVPGLLQIESYAEQALIDSGMSPGPELNEQVHFRLTRQQTEVISAK